MNIYDTMFLFCLFAMVAITLAKIYSVMSMGKWYDLRISFLLFAIFMLCYLGVMVVFFYNPERLIYHIFYQLSNWLIALNMILLAIEALFHIDTTSTKAIESYQRKPSV